MNKTFECKTYEIKTIKMIEHSEMKSFVVIVIVKKLNFETFEMYGSDRLEHIT